MEEISKHESKSIFLRGLISSLNFKKRLLSIVLKKESLEKVNTLSLR